MPRTVWSLIVTLLLTLRIVAAFGATGVGGDNPPTSWSTIRVPGAWEEVSGARFADLDGCAWYRCRVRVPERWWGEDRAWASSDLDGLPELADFDQVVLAESIERKAADEEDGPLSPNEALKRFRVPPDLRIEQVLAEPTVRQPVSLSFDERGRLWVVQYLQYPEPAGLKMLSRDGVWRIVYDKVSPPPPHHFPGKDKITIHEDTDGDGAFDRHKTFVDGLNIVTAVAHGRGGVWVLNPPYLLFYPDRDRDDVPDGDPEVHLEGFGIEDTHSVVNSLRWGPDGWLYAAQGSTVSGDVKRPSMDDVPVHSLGQLIWRYHPETRRYEVFAEGGGNAFGVEFDAKGRVFSGHNGGNTRGFHYVQGGYYQKGFDKHGPLSNPYAFGYFPAMKHNNVPRFTHTFIIYEGGALPEPYEGCLFGVAPLLNHVVRSEVRPDGSSIQTRDIDHPVTTSDPWFRPVDIKTGPDGALYIADWYDHQVNHYRNHEGQIDKENGRVYRLEAAEARPLAPFDLAKCSTEELVALLDHKNKWFRQTALRMLGDRKDRAAIPLLFRKVRESTGQPALEALWGLNLSNGFDDAVALEFLNHEDPFVRIWTVRLLGDARQVSPTIAAALAKRAKVEPNVETRSQLASSARRLPANDALPIVRNLLAHDEDADDSHLPLLLWWAIEAKAESDRAAVVALFRDRSLWDRAIIQQTIAERLMRRYAAAGGRENLLTCAELLKMAPGEDHARRLLTGLETAMAGPVLTGLPVELAEALETYQGGSVLLGLRQGKPEAVAEALKVIADPKADKTRQLQYIQIFGEIDEPKSVPVLLDLVRQSPDNVLRGAALAALQRYRDPKIGTVVLESFSEMTDDVRSEALALLASRELWARELLEAVGTGRINRSSVPIPIVQRLQRFSSEQVKARVRKLWPEVRPATSEELQERIDRAMVTLLKGTGDPRAGQMIFKNKCSQCHMLFGEGGKVGPDLTAYKRGDTATMLLSIVNPSAEIREGYTNVLISTLDGRTINGILVDRDRGVVVLRTGEGRDVTIRVDEIDEIEATPVSIMPEGLLNDLNDQQVRDLFAFLRSTQPPK